MKNLLFLFLLLFTTGVCHGQEKKTGQELKRFSWTGTINKKIPVDLDFTVFGLTVVGEIHYLNTKSHLPIKIIGSKDAEDKYTLCEFGKDGNISGVLYGKLTGDRFEGEWSSTKSDGTYPLSLVLKDNRLVKPVIFPATDITGKYNYQYGEKGYQGGITIKKLKGNNYEYEIGSVTSDPARNMADASGTAVLKNNGMIIEVNKSCRFKVTFYNGFLVIGSDDELGGCEFGFNATLSGTYLKLKN